MPAVAFALLCVFPGSVGAQEKSYPQLPDGAMLVRPKHPGVTTGWSILPGVLKKLNDKPLSFNVAPNGKICLAGKRALFYPEIPLVLTTRVPISEFIWLAEGNMLVHSGKALGFLKVDPEDEKNAPGKTKKGDGTLSFTPLFTIPYERSRLYAGLGDFFYLVGRNDKENRNEISAWNLADEKVPVKPLYATDAPISAVAGSPEKTYFATGRAVFMLKKGATAAEPVYVHELEDIRELIYRPDVGLFFTTDNGAGYIGEKEQFVFLAYPGVQMRLRGNALHVRMGSVANGIFRITGPQHFADLRLDPKK